MKSMKGKVLVIEDNLDWQADIKEYLEFDGFHVEIANNLEAALKKVREHRFHFITIDMQLDEKNMEADKFEGWSVLELVKKLRIQDITPAMIITGFGEHYKMLKSVKKVESLFFMEKGEFDRKTFLEIINREVERIDLRFKNDYRGD